MFIGLLSAVMQSDIPGRCLEVWGNTGTKHTVTDMLRYLQCAMRADTCGLVFLCVCAWMHSVFVLPVYCFCRCVCVHAPACVFIVYWGPKVTCQDTDVRKLRHSESDKQTMPGVGSKQCAPIALLLSVCPRCRVTEVFYTIKAFSMVQHCVCVFALAEAPLWLVILDLLKQSQTHNRSRKQLGPAIVHNSSLNTLCFPLRHTPVSFSSTTHFRDRATTSFHQQRIHSHISLSNICMLTLRSHSVWHQQQ